MKQRRLVGIDLGVTSWHTVVICDETGEVLARRRALPTRDSLEAIAAVALHGVDDGFVLEVVIEPTAMSWFPVAVFFIERGHVVYRVSSAKSADARKLLSRQAKTNSIDAEALARLPIIDRRGVIPLELPRADHATLRRRVRPRTASPMRAPGRSNASVNSLGWRCRRSAMCSPERSHEPILMCWNAGPTRAS